MSKTRKYIFVTGGVMSGVGKGITTSSIGKIMQARGFNVTAVKIDPYVNVDAGTMNPTEHGEVFVLSDGYETDQDMGNYERFLGITLTNQNYMTTGRVYQHVIEKERNLEYGGKCVEVVPHIPLEIIRRIEKASSIADSDITLIEIGGTVGEYQNILFLEAARMMKIKHPKDVLFVMVSYLPIPDKVGEMKTKPTQYAVRTLNSTGIQPDIIVARSSMSLDKKRKEKIAISCNILSENIISAPDVESIYDVPLNFEKDKISDIITDILGLKKRAKKSDLSDWRAFVNKTKNHKSEINIAVVGKYFDTGDFVFSDSYISVIEAVKYSAYKLGVKAKMDWVNSKNFEDGVLDIDVLKNYDGILVPGGFGSSGIEGIINTIKYARENKIPYFGLCYGMQLAVIEYARNVLGLKDANTAEINPNSENLVIDIMPEQKQNIAKGKYGGTMRLGSYEAFLEKGSLARKAYDAPKIEERHRHRFEVNNDYIEKLTQAGMVFSGISPNGRLMEIMELSQKEHPFFLGTQFHPELKARPLSPHPLFTEFIKAGIERNKKK